MVLADPLKGSKSWGGAENENRERVIAGNKCFRGGF